MGQVSRIGLEVGRRVEVAGPLLPLLLLSSSFQSSFFKTIIANNPKIFQILLLITAPKLYFAPYFAVY